MKKLLFLLFPCLILAGCGSNNQATTSSGMANSNELVTFQGEPAADKLDSTVELTSEDSLKKFVYTGYQTIETTTYDTTLQALRTLVNDNGATIEYISESAYGTLRHASLTLRVPSESFEDFLSKSGTLGNITSQSSQRDDITRHYNDTSIRKEALTVEKDNLMALLKQATSVEDMLAIEQRLSEVQTELNQLESELANLDTDVALSTIYVDLNEVVEYSNQTVQRKQSTFFDRLGNTIVDSWNFFVKLLEKGLFLLIYLFPIACVVLLVAWLVHLYRKKHPKLPRKPVEKDTSTK